jgi:hypothetical protein
MCTCHPGGDVHRRGGPAVRSAVKLHGTSGSRVVGCGGTVAMSPPWPRRQVVRRRRNTRREGDRTTTACRSGTMRWRLSCMLRRLVGDRAVAGRHLYCCSHAEQGSLWQLPAEGVAQKPCSVCQADNTLSATFSC